MDHAMLEAGVNLITPGEKLRSRLHKRAALRCSNCNQLFVFVRRETHGRAYGLNVIRFQSNAVQRKRVKRGRSQQVVIVLVVITNIRVAVI